ncbi:MAG TPA: alpha/beta fold hydrolase [Chloroflexia bacterium]|nr:alpha/beta fold hydrolase [Chloroflexia bacterium]
MSIINSPAAQPESEQLKPNPGSGTAGTVPPKSLLQQVLMAVLTVLKWLVITLVTLLVAVLVLVSLLSGPTPLPVSLLLAITWIGLILLVVLGARRFGKWFAQLGGTLGLVILGLLAVGISQVSAYTPPIIDAQGRTVPGSIATLEKIRLGGSDEWISIRGNSTRNPVLLFLAGGPGGSQLATERYALGGLEDHFVVVNWEQPGSGKSFEAVDRATITPERYISDAHELILNLKQRFGVEKVYVVGESWGSALGIMLVQRYPELFHAFIGTGQMVAFKENDIMCYEFALRWAQERGDTKKVEQLKNQGPPPYYGNDVAWKEANFLLDTFSYMNQNPAIYDGGDTIRDILSPEYGLYDKVNWVRGPLDTLNHVYPQLWDVDFRKQATRLEVPVYFLIGRYDINAPVSLTEDYYRVLEAPHKEIVWFEHSGHTPWTREPDKFVDVVVNKVLPETQFQSPVIAKYHSQLPSIIQQNNIPGLAVALVDDKQVLWSEGFGYTGVDQKTPVTPQTLFSMQSVSKNFTSVAVLMAVQDGLLDLDTPINVYLPDFKINSIFDEHPEQKITLKHLLSHTAGFTHEAPVGSNYDNTPTTFEEHVKSISNTWLKFPVGQGYSYSNLGIDLAAYILQVRTGKPFTQYMQEKLLNPVGMTASSFDMTYIKNISNRAIGHDTGIANIPLEVPMLGAGGLYSSADDMARYVQFQMNGGLVNTGAGSARRVVAESLLETTYAPPSPLTRQQGAGWGVFVGKKYNTYYIGTGGGGFGFLTDLLWYPELKLGIVTLTNSANHQLQNKLSSQILDELIDDPSSVFHQRVLSLTGQTQAPWEKQTDTGTVKAADVPQLLQKLAQVPTAQDFQRWQQYVGDYQIKIWGQPSFTISLYQAGDHLFVKLLDTAIKLEEVKPGLFYMDSGEAVDLRGPVFYAQGIRLYKIEASATP